MLNRPDSGTNIGDNKNLFLLRIVCLLLAAGQVPAHGNDNAQMRSETGLRAADGSQVEFAPPFSIDCLISSLAVITVVHHDSANVVPQAAQYTLNIPVGLQVYRDAAGTMPIATGQTLVTRATGYDTLWAGTTPDTSTVRVYLLSIPSSPWRMTLTYRAGPSATRTLMQKDGRPSSRAFFHDALGRTYGSKSKDQTSPGKFRKFVGKTRLLRFG